MPDGVSDLIDVVRRFGPLELGVDLGRYCVATLIVTLAAYLLTMRGPGRRIQRRRATRWDVVREVAMSMRTIIVFACFGMFILWSERAGLLSQPTEITVGPTLLTVAGLVLWHDTWFYWTHRAMHLPALYKRVHLAHHRSVTPTPFAAYAFSASEAVVEAAFLPIWLFIVPTSLVATFLFLNIMIVRNVVGHAGVELHPRGWIYWPIVRWLNTTVHHDLHHAGRFDRNFGLYFRFWDRAMGTEHVDYERRFREATAGRPSDIGDTRAELTGTGN